MAWAIITSYFVIRNGCCASRFFIFLGVNTRQLRVTAEQLQKKAVAFRHRKGSQVWRPCVSDVIIFVGHKILY